MTCTVPDCTKPAALLKNGKPRHGGRCHAHAKRFTRHKPLQEDVREYRSDPGTRLREAALAYAEAPSGKDSDAKLKGLWERLRKLARRYKGKPGRPKSNRSNVQMHGDSNS